MNRRRFVTWLILPTATALLLADTKVSDGQIHDQVLLRLSRDPDVKGGGFQIDVTNGVVTVKGTVDKEKTKQKAERLIKKIKGVTGVKNLIEVKPAGSAR